MDKALIHFVIGSSPIMMIFPYILLYNAYYDLTPEEQEASTVSIETILLTLPLTYGILFAICFNVLSFVPERGRGLHPRFIVAGSVAAGLISIVYHYCFRIHTHWFKCEYPHLIHVGVILFYLMVYYSLGEWVRAQILYGPQPKSSLSLSPSPPPSPIQLLKTNDSSTESKLEMFKKLKNQSKK